MAFEDPTPFQTPPTMKNAAGLSRDNEYLAIWTGQSNSRPWGYVDDAFTIAQQLVLEDTGVVLNDLVIPDLATREVGMTEVLTTSTVLNFAGWRTSTWLRIGASAFGLPVASGLGYGKVISNSGSSVTVKWISLPANNTTTTGYLVRENGKFASYEQLRILTPYVPIQDPAPPASGGGTTWIPPIHSPYPAADGLLSAGGRRLTLPAPYTLPTAVTKFDDLAVFLPLTHREGSVGYGISEIADATFAGIGAPVGHPITDITTGVFTFDQAIAATADLTGGYLIVDWESGGESKRSWARIQTNTTTTFTPDPASWLGDGVPADPASSAVTFDDVNDEVDWMTHPLVDGDRVAFFGTTAPSGIDFGRIYRVRNASADAFQVAESLDHPTIDIGLGAVAVSAVKVWPYTAWIPHFKDNPHMWIPGPEFGYANEDQQPRGTYVHFRARGQLLFVHQDNANTGSTAPVPEILPFDKVQFARFGAMLPFAWRVSSALGKRINMVAIGANSAPLAPGATPNYFAHLGTVGWWNYEQYGYGLALEDSDSLMSKRLKRLITFMAPEALKAEGNTKPPKYLSVCHVQGETDSLIDAGREIYKATITDYKDWLRELVDSINASPFEGEAKMPFAQPLLTKDPWERGGTGASFQEFGTDLLGFGNNAIKEAHTAEEFSGYTITEDIPKLLYRELTPGKTIDDNAHFSGQGMVWQGGRLAALILELLEHALSYSSAALDTTNPRLLRIANLALQYVGQGACIITSLSETTREAQLVSLMLPGATQQLLSMRTWSWATRFERATQVKHDNPDWLYAYVVPARAVTPLRIIPPPEVVPVTSSILPPSTLGVDDVLLTPNPEPFEIGRSDSGHRILYCNVAEVEGDIDETKILDGVLHPERLAKRPLLFYTDKVVDPDRFSESFATALTWLLTSMLAPALVRGREGEVVATRALQRVAGFIGTEAAHETRTQRPTTDHRAEQRPDWISQR